MNNEHRQNYVSMAVGHVQTTRLPSYMLRCYARRYAVKQKGYWCCCCSSTRATRAHSCQCQQSCNGAKVQWEKRVLTYPLHTGNSDKTCRTEVGQNVRNAQLHLFTVERYLHTIPCDSGPKDSHITCVSAPGRRPSGLVLA